MKEKNIINAKLCPIYAKKLFLISIFGEILFICNAEPIFSI